MQTGYQCSNNDRFVRSRTSSDQLHMQSSLSAVAVFSLSDGPVTNSYKKNNSVDEALLQHKTYHHMLTDAFMNSYGIRPRLFPLSSHFTISDYYSSHYYKSMAEKRFGVSVKNQTPELILDAPGIIDDYYLNLLDWGSENILAIALSDSVYLWNSETQETSQLMNVRQSLIALGEENVYISSVHFLKQNGFHLALGLSNGLVQIWDIIKGTILMEYKDAASISFQQPRHSQALADCSVPAQPMNRLAALVSSPSHSLLFSGCRYGPIYTYDTRKSSSVGLLEAHSQEVCGLSISPSGALLASGGNDNLIHIWDLSKAISTDFRHFNKPLYRFDKHRAAVKALQWHPMRSNLLATGGGSSDRQLCFWNTAEGQCLQAVDTKSQVCMLKWSLSGDEIVTAHGFARNELNIWLAFPFLQKFTSIPAHPVRVLQMSMSPDGLNVITASADETLKFWNLFKK